MEQGAKHWHTRLAAAALLLLGLWITGCSLYVPDVDIAQQRFDAATPPLDGQRTLVQSFICRHANLYQIELLPAVYETPRGTEASPSAGRGTLTFLLRNLTGHTEPVRQTVDVTDVHHNVPLRFTFAPQNDSAGQAYELLIDGQPGVRVGLWYDSVNAYGGGQLECDGCTGDGDLHFVTRHRYDLPMMAGSARALLKGGGLTVPLIVLLVLPGYLLWHGLGLARGMDPVVSLGMVVAISLAAVPVVLLWSTVLDLRWERMLCLTTFVLLGACAVGRLVVTRLEDLAVWTRPGNRASLLAALAIFVTTMLLRFVQVRNLVLPAWVDSPQHALVTELVATHGQVPRSYEPLLPVNSFVYHFGFHADNAVFHWLSGLAIPQAMLVLGQVLNASSVLMAYLLTWRLTQRKVAALSAAVATGMISYLPAYYVSWGRYTQLTGLLLLPPALATVMDWVEKKQRDYRLLTVAGLLQAGLVLTHARVTVFSACTVITYLAIESALRWRDKDSGGLCEVWRRAAAFGVLAMALSGPWLLQVVSTVWTALRASGGGLSGDPAYNVFPWEFLLIAHNRELMVLAAGGAAWGVLRRKKQVLWLVVSCAVVALVVNPGWLGLESTNLLNNATAVIALFLPLSVLSGQAITAIWDLGPRLFTRLGLPRSSQAMRGALVLLIVIMALWSAWGMVTVVNPNTVLATAEDMEAMSWIRENTASDSVFLTNTRYWQLGAYVGTDGGYWIPQLTGRRTLLPALSYTYGTPEYVQHITTLADTVSKLEQADDPRLLQILQQEGVTHVYIGAKGGKLTPQMFLGSSHYGPVYSGGEVWIFEVADQRTKKGTAYRPSGAR